MQPQDPLKKALKLLEKTARTEAEITLRLKKNDYSDELIAETITKLKDYGYLDDNQLAEREVQTLAPLKGIGKNRIRQKLLQRGIEEEVADPHLQNVNDDQELTKALALLKKRYPNQKDLTKAGNFLLRRGFEEDIVRSALSQHFPEAEDLY